MELKLEWTRGAWEAPDGKKVPYYEADLYPLFQHATILESILRNDDLQIEEFTIRRWPKNTAVKIVIADYSGYDDYDWDYTFDGDGDGYVPGHSYFKAITLLKLPTREFDADPVAAFKRVGEMLVNFDWEQIR